MNHTELVQILKVGTKMMIGKIETEITKIEKVSQTLGLADYLKIECGDQKADTFQLLPLFANGTIKLI